MGRLSSLLAGITFDGTIQLLAFCLFEVCVGVFWPSMMSMRAQYVPEEMRSTIINLFRCAPRLPAAWCRTFVVPVTASGVVAHCLTFRSIE